MPRAFTLPEIVLALALGGILLGLAVPRLSEAIDRIEVRVAAGHLVAAHQRARMMAITHGQVLVLSIEPDELIIRPRGQRVASWSQPGPSANGVTLAGPPHQVAFSPEGFSFGLSNATLRLHRGSATRTVTLSRLGRVRVTR